MVELVQTLVNGLSLSALYGLLAVGLTLIFGVARIGNFAHGDFLMIGGYALFFLHEDGSVPLVFAGIGAVAASVLIGLASERLVFSRLYEAPGFMMFIAALGLSVLLQNASLWAFGAAPRTIDTAASSSRIEWLGVSVTGQRLFAIVAAVAAFAALGAFLQRARWGKAIRALAQNPSVAETVGVVPRRVWILTMAISSGLAGWAAFVTGPIYPVYPTMGLILVLKAFAVVIVGGLGHIRGAIIGAVLLGITESLTATYLASGYQDAIAFVVLVTVILIRPQGLFGTVEARA